MSYAAHQPITTMTHPSPIKTVAIVGTGFGGLSTAIQLQRARIRDLVLLERNDHIGGTWRDSTFPGAGCDIKSVLYSLSTDPYPEWTHSFADQTEILTYTKQCFKRHELHDRVMLGANVTSARFDEDDRLWQVLTEDGHETRARAIVLACGPLSTPAWPDIPDRQAFRGELFHAARWNHACQLEGKRVAVIGTGATAIQFVPQIVDQVASLTIFQRTPPWIVPKPERQISAFERALYRRWPVAQQAVRRLVYLENELKGLPFYGLPGLIRMGERTAKQHMEKTIHDPELRARLTPHYTLGCKRVLLSNHYYPALLHEHTHLETNGIERFTADGIQTRDGRHHSLDVIICATGYDIHTRPAPFEIIGRNAQKLSECWKDLPQAYKGTTISGFPNLFMLVGPNTRIGHNSQLFMIESQVRYVTSAMRTMRRKGVRAYDVRRDIQDRYNAKLQNRLRGTVWESGCESFYRTPDGQNTTVWPGTTFGFRAITRRFDSSAYEVMK